MTDVTLRYKPVCRACTGPFIGGEVQLMETPYILELFQTLSTTKVDANDNVSKSICLSCNHSLENYDKFRTMCKESYKVLVTFPDTLKIEKDNESIKDENLNQSNEQFYEEPSIDCDITCDSACDDGNDIDNKIDSKDTEFDPLSVCDLKINVSELVLDPSPIKPIKLVTELESVESDDEVLADIIRKSKRKSTKSELEVVKSKRKKLIESDTENNVAEEEIVREESQSSEINSEYVTNKRRGRGSIRRNNKARKRPKPEKDTETTDDGESAQKRRKDKLFVCDKCPKSFMKKVVYEGHMRQHEGLKPFACDKCNKKYSRLERLRNHLLNDHSGEPRRFCCDVGGCDKKYRNRETLKRHINAHFNPPKPPIDKSERQVFICELCGKQLSTKGVLKEHEMMHKGEFPYACDICPRRFRVPNKLYLHKLRHQGIKNFECKICGLKKTTNKELKSHMNVHTREKQYPCKFCDIIFLTNGNLVRHVQVVHDGIKLYACSFCDKAFGKAETLRNHTMKHTGERPLPCPHCERRFISRTSLLYHVRTHKMNAVKAENNEVKPEEEDVVANEAMSSS